MNDPDDSEPVPLADLDDRAAALARRLGLVRTSTTGDEFILPADLERLGADLLRDPDAKGGNDE